ncbi:hypothetical protein D3C77_807440 [compost metagenome]
MIRLFSPRIEVLGTAKALAVIVMPAGLVIEGVAVVALGATTVTTEPDLDAL